MDIIDLTHDQAFTTRRPWSQWADGQWRRVLDVKDDDYRQFRSSIHSWANRSRNAAKVSRNPDGHMFFQLTIRPSTLAGQYVLFSFQFGGWWADDVLSTYEYADDLPPARFQDNIWAARRVDQNMAVRSVGAFAERWDRAVFPMPPLLALDLGTLPDDSTDSTIRGEIAWIGVQTVMALAGVELPATPDPTIAEIIRRAPKED